MLTSFKKRPLSPNEKALIEMKCTLCGVEFFGSGFVCAPLGRPGDRCCEECSANVVKPSRFSSIGNRAREDDDDALLRAAKRPRVASYNFAPKEDNTVVDIAKEEELDDSCDPGVEAEFNVISEDSKYIKIAVKPPTTPQNLVVDVIVGCDATASMNGLGDEGLINTLTNFDVLVEKSLKKIKDSERIRRSTNINFFKFGENAYAFDDENEGFFSLDALKPVAKSIAKTITFEECFTNFENATNFAANIAKTRAQAMAAQDLANGIHRVFAFVLITDGGVNDGERCPTAIINSANKTLSDVNASPFSVFAIGLGDSTKASFLSRFCSTGFWKHVEDPTNPADAFEATVGRIFSTINSYTIQSEIQIERGGEMVAHESHSKHFGLLNEATCRARIVKIPVPEGARLGDKLKIKTKIGFGNEYEITVDIGAVSKSTENPKRLYNEAIDLENAVKNLKDQILYRGSTKEIEYSSSPASFAVRTFMNSYHDLVQNTSIGSSICTASFYTRSFTDDHAVQSSFSQIES